MSQPVQSVACLPRLSLGRARRCWIVVNHGCVGGRERFEENRRGGTAQSVFAGGCVYGS